MKWLVPLTLLVVNTLPLQGSASELHLGNGQEPKSLDPALATGITEINVINNLFEGLTTLHPYDLTPLPGLAESWQISADQKTYTFKIRKNAKWTDGSPITAKDFVWAWRRVVNPETASEFAFQLFHLKNARKINRGEEKDLSKLGVQATDKRTLKVFLERPTPFFLQLTAFATLMPVPRHVIEQKINIPWTDPGRMVSSGPYKLADWKMHQHIKVERNPHYYKKPMGADSAFFYPYEQETTEENLFRQGKLHLTYRVPSGKGSYYQKKYKKRPYNPYKADPYLGTYFYRINTTKKPLDNKDVRKARKVLYPTSGWSLSTPKNTGHCPRPR